MTSITALGKGKPEALRAGQSHCGSFYNNMLSTGFYLSGNVAIAPERYNVEYRRLYASQSFFTGHC